LAAKGMIKSAALWRTRAETCQVPLLEGHYVGWLMQTGQTEQALRPVGNDGQARTGSARAGAAPRSRRRC